MPHVAPALLVASGLLAALAGCEAVPASSQPPASLAQSWICGREFVNHAWGYVRYGTVIDRDGNVWRYNIRNMPANTGHPWNAPNTNKLSEDDLKARYNGATKTDIHVSLEDIARHFPLIAEASNGKLTEPRMTAADMGEFVSYCYQYDATQHSYRQVILKQHGDLTMENTSQAAHDLASWIDKVLGKDY